MAIDSGPAAFYGDLGALARLRAQAGNREQSPQALHEAARQFEALFLQMVLKNMRAAGFGDSLFDSHQGELYRDMLDRQLAASLARRKSLGIADLLVRQLAPGTVVRAPAQVSAVPATIGPARPQRPAVEPAEVQPEAATRDAPFESAASFVRAVWPHARDAAKSLGIAPRALVAQAALETGWGQAVIRGADGRSSHNLFGIKADTRWDGPRVAVPTMEYQNGVLARTRAAFRAYDSVQESFADYVRFLQSNRRYSVALEQAGRPERFFQALQEAGYATDPRYADKVLGIMRGDTLDGALAGVNDSQKGPLT